ncbi:hypothetical protein O181_100460 [Austropuccinia psidii MF-1]|uniref:Uncharacterized protein n=1 Tax=Austropuccinia psidii MF-1 TaxID=1389203 RepID=A0A9Q3JCS3_9BASI|nr:hypothetical protein [Austropuccinia psidii MF-1]
MLSYWEESFKHQEVFFEQRDVARWTNVGGSIPVGGRSIYSSSGVPSSRINNEGIVKRIRQIANSTPDPAGHPPNTSPSQHPANRFQSHIIRSTPRNFQPTLATIPPVSPSSSHTKPSLSPAVRPSPIQHARNIPIVTSQQLQPVASTSRRREELSFLLFPDAQVFQQRDCWPIGVTREDPNTASENQDAVARLFRRFDRNSREVIMYTNDRTILRPASEEVAAKFAWYEYELISYFQKTFDHLGRDKS